MKVMESESCVGSCVAGAKWAGLMDDVLVPLPQRVVKVSVIRAQASVPDEFVIVRDHNSPNDVVLDDDGQVDLAQGNVFYRLARCEVQPRDPCHDAPKRAFIVNDRSEITTRADQNGKMIRELFGLAGHVQLFRDREGPHDENISLDDTVKFVDGPVFYSRQAEVGLKITVNSRLFTQDDGVKPRMTGLMIAALAYPDKPSETRVIFVPENREIALHETVHIKGCEVFEVTRKDVTGGFEASRVERELSMLREGGQQVTLLTEPSAVVFHGLRARRGSETTITDVLVPVPGGYPGNMIDLAYLPDGSPLIGKVKGKPQGEIAALGRKWRQISYHPHNGGGAPAWNPTIHGFHTYLGEVLSWLSNQQ